MDSAKQQLADRLKSANNILVTVSHDPSVDQLAALLGLTLLLNKQGKHSVAVFSGQVPSTIEFLEPETTIEKNTDSLRDFIIALDKNKADKLRYKVEDDVVRIFITPYKTSISQEDLEFSQGDFNVDVVVALGVKQQQDLDDAITAHGRILHDATVASLNIGPDGNLGTINWNEQQASSLSELVTELAQLMGDNVLDNQIATALLTGIVAETDRFSNDKTSSQTMSVSSVLMAAGANQQLVASKLEEPPAPPADQPSPESGSGEEGDQPAKSDDGTLSIKHDPGEGTDQKSKEEASQPPSELPVPQPSADDKEAAETAEPPAPPAGPHISDGPQIMTEPPKLGGTLSANTKPESLDPVTDPLSLPSDESNRILSRSDKPAPAPMPAPAPAPTFSSLPVDRKSPPPAATPTLARAPAPTPSNSDSPTLSQIEQSVNSPHVAPPPKIDDARDEVSKALSASPAVPKPIKALNAQPLGDDLHPPKQPPLPKVEPSREPTLPIGPTPPESSDTDPKPKPAPGSLSPAPEVHDPTAPPPVPPPMPFQFGSKSSTPPNQSGTPL